MFIDRAKIYVKSGNGGNGAVTFRREKYAFIYSDAMSLS